MFRIIIYLPHSSQWTISDQRRNRWPVKFMSMVWQMVFVKRQQYTLSSCAAIVIAADVLKLTLYPKLARHRLSVTEPESQFAFWWCRLEENTSKSLSKINKRHFLQTSETCSDHWSVLSKMTPRYFWLSTTCKGAPSIQISGGKDDNLDLDRNHITLHFEIFNCILLFLIQTASWDKSIDIFCQTTAWVIPEQIKAVSSANWRSLPYVTCADISFTYIKNNNGPKALSWVPPLIKPHYE